MKAIGYKKPLPINDPESLLDLEVPTPEANGRDLVVEVVEVKAVSVNISPGGREDRRNKAEEPRLVLYLRKSTNVCEKWAARRAALGIRRH
jgi:hypothetical protein